MILDIFFTLVFLFIGFNLKNLYNFNQEEKKILNTIFIYHIIVCLASLPIFDKNDGFYYWMAPKQMEWMDIWLTVVENPKPTQIMYLLNFFPSNVLQLSFPVGMIMYSILGYWAFIFIILTVKTFIPDLTELKQVKVFGFSIFPYIFLLPNMHFWSVAVGKDTLLFFSVSIIIYSLFNLKRRWFGAFVAIIIGYYLRPHVLLFLTAGYGAAYILSSKFSLFQKIAFAAVGSLIFFPLLSSVLDFTKIDQLTTDQLENFSTSRSSALSKAGSGVDFSGYPYPLKVLTFIFRPFFFDINGIPAFIASLENLIQLLLFYFFFKNKSIKFVFKANVVIRTCFFYFVIGALAFAPVMSNLGIIIREKNMLMPAFLIFILASVKYKLITTTSNGTH